jgi:hypothetical protein
MPKLMRYLPHRGKKETQKYGLLLQFEKLPKVKHLPNGHKFA